METKFKALFTPLKMNSVMLRNRVLVSPMGVPKATIISSTNYGGVSIMDRSRGGAAVVTVNYKGLAGIGDYNDPFEKYARDPSREALSVMRQAGALANLQIFFHPEIPHVNDNTDRGATMMPSDCIDFRGKQARAMTKEEIRAKIDELVANAVAAKNFGFDMVMLHFGHDSLTSLFLSPVWNKRTDEYGGSLENRIRITKEAAAAVRKAVGPDYPVMIRISRSLWVPESYSEDDMIELLKAIKDDVDMVNVSYSMDCYGGTIDKYDANVHMSTINFEPHGTNVAFCARVKKEIPGLLVCPIGAIMTPEEAEEIVAQGKADAVMLGRAMVADPFWVRKAQENRPEDIVPCLRCGQCYHISTEHYNTVCSVNPRFRRENRVPLILSKAPVSKKVVIIGGGPAGCRAALTACERGHRVILLEQSQSLGGQINVSDYDNYKQDLRRYRDYLRCQVEKAAIEVRYGVEATPEYVKALEPDSIIIAVGAEPIKPRIKGAEFAVQALEVYPQLNTIRGKKVVVIGGGTIGSELSLELAERGNTVTVVELGDTLAAKGNWLYRLSLYQHMNKCEGLRQCTEAEVERIEAHGVSIRTKGGECFFVESDLTVIAVGMKPRREIAHSFYGITPDTYMIGDCCNVAKVIEATNDGYFTAANL